MHRVNTFQNDDLFSKIKELSTPSKFKIIETLESGKMTITNLAKKVNLAFNKCSNYCSDLEKVGFVEKEKDGKNVFVKSTLSLSKLSKFL